MGIEPANSAAVQGVVALIAKHRRIVQRHDRCRLYRCPSCSKAVCTRVTAEARSALTRHTGGLRSRCNPGPTCKRVQKYCLPSCSPAVAPRPQQGQSRYARRRRQRTTAAGRWLLRPVAPIGVSARWCRRLGGICWGILWGDFVHPSTLGDQESCRTAVSVDDFGTSEGLVVRQIPT